MPEGSLAQQMQALIQQGADGELSVDAVTQAVGLIAATAKVREMDTVEATNTAFRNMSPMPVAPMGRTYLAAVQARLSMK